MKRFFVFAAVFSFFSFIACNNASDEEAPAPEVDLSVPSIGAVRSFEGDFLGGSLSTAEEKRRVSDFVSDAADLIFAHSYQIGDEDSFSFRRESFNLTGHGYPYETYNNTVSIPGMTASAKFSAKMNVAKNPDLVYVSGDWDEVKKTHTVGMSYDQVSTDSLDGKNIVINGKAALKETALVRKTFAFDDDGLSLPGITTGTFDINDSFVISAAKDGKGLKCVYTQRFSGSFDAEQVPSFKTFDVTLKVYDGENPEPVMNEHFTTGEGFTDFFARGPLDRFFHRAPLASFFTCAFLEFFSD